MTTAHNKGWDFVKVGGTYQYKEDWFIATVEVLEDNSTDDEYRFKLQTKTASCEPPSEDGIFEISHVKDLNGYYSGMMNLYKNPDISSKKNGNLKLNKQIIKWSGSKRSQSKIICDKIPNKQYDSYNEPFCGSASILIEILNREDKNKFGSFNCSDINEDLINIWNFIKNKPEELLSGYKYHWNEFNKNDIQHRKDYFELIRSKYNIEHNPIDFMFIMRTTTNGMPRYNNSNNFNNSCHFSRPGINPETLYDIILNASDLLNENNVKFTHCSFEDYKNKNSNDFFYLDPPYNATKGMYYGNFITSSFFEWLNNSNFTYILSYDGKIKDGKDYTMDIPVNYKNHEYLESGNSSFRRVIGKNKNSIVSESIYMNF